MKKTICTLSIMVAAFATQAQELVADQNPNYKVSMDKYAASQVTLQSTNNTTIQDTYKAYDWSTAKAERKAERRNFRRERRLYNNFNNGWNDNNYFGNGWNNNNNNWNNNSWGNNWGRGNNNNCLRWIW